jgi:Lipid A 3-O-deacylase (PagL)
MGREKCLLLSALFFASLPCYSLGSDHSTSAPVVFGCEDALGVLPVFWLRSDDLGVTANHLADGKADSDGSPDKIPDAATTSECPLDGGQDFGNSVSSVPHNLPNLDGTGDHTATSASKPANASGTSPVERVQMSSQPTDRSREFYYRNKTELAFDLGTFPINIPFPFDFMEGDPYTEHPLKYNLVPAVLSLRWQMTNIGGPWIFRGNWDLTSSGSFTWIPSGPETRFISYDMGLRRNFVPRNRNYATYWDIRLGVGQINAKGPKGVPYAQGENWPEFTMNLGTGVRYNFSPRLSFTAGLNYMHISNMDLSEHKPNATDPNWGPINYGINVFGPQLGINMRLGKPLHGE